MRAQRANPAASVELVCAAAILERRGPASLMLWSSDDNRNFRCILFTAPLAKRHDHTQTDTATNSLLHGFARSAPAASVELVCAAAILERRGLQRSLMLWSSDDNRNFRCILFTAPLAKRHDHTDRYGYELLLHGFRAAKMFSSTQFCANSSARSRASSNEAQLPSGKMRHPLRCRPRPLPSAIRHIRRYPWPLWKRRSLPGHDAACVTSQSVT